MKILAELKKFAFRGNLLDMAVGFSVGAAFTTIAQSLVNDILMPPLALLLGQANFANMIWVLRDGAAPGPYATLLEAQTAGAITLNYGAFINNLIAFLLVTVAMFFIIRVFNKLDEALDKEFVDEKEQPDAEAEPVDKKCPYCRSVIAFKATRCPLCTSQLEGAE